MVFFSDIEINDEWLSELVAQGYSQLVEESNEEKHHTKDTSMEVDYSSTSDCLHEKNTGSEGEVPVNDKYDTPDGNNAQKRNTETRKSNTQSLESGNAWIHPFDREIEHPFQMSSLQLDDPSLDIADNDILSIAPSEGERPVNQVQSEALCFPKEFPLGNNTFLTRTESGEFKQNRKLEISLTKYFDARILSMDNRFVSNPEYVFYAQYLKERQQIRDAAKIALKKGPSCTADGSQLTAEMLVDNNKFRKNILKNSLGYKTFSDNRATPPYWEKTMNGLFAAFKQIGPATFFLSFSAADRRWPEIAKAILIQQNKDPALSDTLDWSEYCQLINSNALTAVLMFERRVSQFLKLLTSKAQPLGGEVTDIFLRREHQV